MKTVQTIPSPLASLHKQGNGMKLREVVLLLGTLVYAHSCWSSASGAYLSRGQGFAELIQITQAKDGHLLGTLSHASLKTDGTIEQSSNGLTGVADGRSITLKVDAPMSLGVSMSGAIDDKTITLNFPTGMQLFVLVEPTMYQDIVKKLTAEGLALQQTKLLQKQDAEVADLNRRLREYAARVTGASAFKEQNVFHAVHEKVLGQARQFWGKVQTYPRGSYQADQVKLAIEDVSFNFDSFSSRYEDAVKLGRSHIAGYDDEIVKTHCQRDQVALTHCAEQGAVIRVYQEARPVVLKRMDDYEVTLRNDKAAMKEIVDQAKAYAKSR